ncbi:circularly permuted type 2 ATP-grasp protein [Propionibacteriaceae bacterium Y1923]|uniref:circularly permuted type 2 ATP-grasp protein n=1 Tax=Aestuariimicrobium sp. Y1814 TaxID=3418742 RepID=UPI003C247B25
MSAEGLDWTSSALAPYADLTHANPDAAAYDEVVGADGVRPAQQVISAAVEGLGLSGLLAARAEARRLVIEDGVHYGGTLHPRRWTLDPIPVVIDSQDWARLEAGLTQRLVVLNALLADLYGEQRLLHSGVLPAELVLGHEGFLHQAHGIEVFGNHHLSLVGTDLARGADGNWVALSDRTAAPSGAGYAMVNRRITSRVMADLHRATRLRRLRSFFTAVRNSLLAAAPPGTEHPRGALLWSGSASETAYEQGFLATLLGYSLVEADDLTISDATLWIRDGERRSRVDVLLRRVDSAFCDPLEWRSDSQLGVAGMLEASRQGRLTIANRLGSGVLENAGLNAYLPAISRALLGEDLQLACAPTWWCGDPVQRSHVLAHLDQLVVKPIHRQRQVPSRPGWMLSAAERDDLVRRIEANPAAWVGQDPVLASTTPLVTGTGLVPRRMLLRTFGAASGDGYTMMPGGLARVAGETDPWQISSGTGAASKDVWVLDSEESVPHTLTLPTPQERTLWVEGSDPKPPPPRVADNLFWYGRYGERVDSTARLLAQALDLSEDYGNRAGSTGHQVLQLVRDAVSTLTALPPDVEGPAASSRQLLRRAATDPQLVGSLAHDIRGLVRAAHEVPDILSSGVWPLLSRLEHAMDTPGDDLELDEITGATMGLAGFNTESMVRDPGWGFIDAGVRVERATNALWLLAEVFDTDVPMSVEDQAGEAVMAICESLITHHRRTSAGVAPQRPLHSAMALLVLDPSNPRSVSFQVRQLAADLVLVQDEQLAGQAEALLTTLGSHSGTLLTEGRSQIVAVLRELERDIRGLSQQITRQHFTRPAPRVFRQTSWLTPATPRLRP